MAPHTAIVVEEQGDVCARATERLVIGARTGCDLVLSDPVIADRHCEVVGDGSFRVRDLGSVTGTFVDGAAAEPEAPLQPGSEVVLGITRLGVKVEDRDGVSTLVLELERNAFHFTRAKKKAFDNDPDLWVQTELGLAQFGTLRVLNRVAIVAALVLVIAGTVLTSVIEPLVDPGPLSCGHAALFQGADAPDEVRASIVGFAAQSKTAMEQGCSSCHEGGATPVAKCMQCHEEFSAEGSRRHPFVGDGVLGAPGKLEVGDELCSLCHIDHAGSAWLKESGPAMVGNCEECHGTRPDLPAIPPVARRSKEVVPYYFNHDTHVAKVGIECGICHVADSQITALAQQGLHPPNRDDFAVVPFETCAQCHVEGAESDGRIPDEMRAKWTPPDEYVWDVAWHGSEEGAKTCKQCHEGTTRDGAERYGPKLRSVARLRLDAAEHAEQKARYELSRRSHGVEFQRWFDQHDGGRQCNECHRKPKRVSSDGSVESTFWHGLHMPSGLMTPVGENAQERVSQTECLSCHGDRRDSMGLLSAENGWWRADHGKQGSCGDCHKEGDEPLPIKPVAVSGWPEDKIAMGVDFPHKMHMKVKGGCFACHEFADGGGAFRQVPATLPGARDCTSCHGQHKNVGGGSCAACHPSPPDAFNVFHAAAAQLPGDGSVPARPQRDWPVRNGFSHFQPGHKGEECGACHDGAQMKGVRGIAAVPIPDETSAGCRECHLRTRFHWR